MSRHGENIRKRKDGRWEARYACKKDGRTCYKSVYGKTYLQAKHAREVKRKEDSEKKIERSKELTVSELLFLWLDYRHTELKISTCSRYSFLIQRQIIPDIGNIPLKNLTGEDLMRFSKNKLENGRLDGRGGLSAKTVADILSVLKLALGFAKEQKLTDSQELFVHIPKQKHRSIQIFTRKEQEILERFLYESIQSETLGILLSLYTGLRIGEVCALRWKDIELFYGYLRVRHTMLRIPVAAGSRNKTKILIERPKTECSIRKIPLPRFLVQALQSCRKQPDCYVLTGSTCYMEPRSYYRRYERILKECGLKKYNYHALRHTFATRCVENEFDLKSLSEILGHANVATTLRCYVHPSMDLKQHHMNRLEKITVCGQSHGPLKGKAGF